MDAWSKAVIQALGLRRIKHVSFVFMYSVQPSWSKSIGPRSINYSIIEEAYIPLRITLWNGMIMMIGSIEFGSKTRPAKPSRRLNSVRATELESVLRRVPENVYIRPQIKMVVASSQRLEG